MLVPGQEPLRVAANEAQICQILLNLCVNASDALDGETGSVTVTLGRVGATHPDRQLFEGTGDCGGGLVVRGRLAPDRDMAVLRVTDTAGGIEPAVLKRLFEPFFTTKERGRGTGLGLAVVHGIVEAYQGAYAVRSQLGKGSEFSIYIPMEAGSRLYVPTANEGLTTVRGTESVLVVDDEVDVADMMAIGLERLGYDVTSYNDPLEALNAFDEDPHAWDVVVTDQAMPGIKGLALASRVKAIRENCIVILCTGFSDGATELAARRAGVDVFLVKPVDPSEVGGQIRRAIEALARSYKLRAH